MGYETSRSIDNISKMRLVEFSYKDDPEKTIHLGFIAHELQEIVPTAVEGTKDEIDENGNPVYQKVLYGRLVPDLVASIQWILKKINELENKQ